MRSSFRAGAPGWALAAVLLAPAPAGPGSLTDEVASLDAAREALAGGDASGALRALDDHDRRFPGGALGDCMAGPAMCPP